MQILFKKKYYFIQLNKKILKNLNISEIFLNFLIKKTS